MCKSCTGAGRHSRGDKGQGAHVAAARVLGEAQHVAEDGPDLQNRGSQQENCSILAGIVEALPARHIGEGSIATLREGCKHEGADKHRTCPSGRLSVCCVSLTRCLRSNEHGAVQEVLMATEVFSYRPVAVVLSSRVNSTSELRTMIRQAQICLRSKCAGRNGSWVHT